MAKKFFSFLRYPIISFFLAIAIASVFIFSLFLEFDCALFISHCLSAFCFFILPIAAFFTPILLKLSKDTSFRYFLCSSLISLLIYILILLTVRFSGYVYLGQFTPEKWEKHYSYRKFMFEDLQKDYQLQGMTKDELQELLGEPRSADEDELVYYYAHSFLDDYNIYFKLEDGKVTDWYWDCDDPNPPPFFGKW